MTIQKIYTYLFMILFSSASIYALADETAATSDENATLSAPSSDSQNSYQNDLNKMIDNSAQSIKDVSESIQQEAVAKTNQEREQKARDYYQQGVTLANEGKLDEAREYFEKAISVTQHASNSTQDQQQPPSPESVPQVQPLKQEANQIKSPQNQIVQQQTEEKNRQGQISIEEEKVYDQALEMFKSNKYDEAKAKFDEVNLVVPGFKDTDKYLQRINKILQKQQAEEAREQERIQKQQLKQAQIQQEALNNQNESIYEQAVSLYRDHKYDDARIEFLKLFNSNLNYKSTKNYLRKINIKLKQELELEFRQKELAVERQRAQELKASNDQTEKLYQEALALYRNHQYEDARDAFNKVKDRDPDYRSTLGYLFKINDNIKEDQEEAERQKGIAVERQQEQELKLKNEQIESVYQQAVSLYRDHQWDKSKVQFEIVEKMSPDFKHTRQYLQKIERNLASESIPNPVIVTPQVPVTPPADVPATVVTPVAPVTSVAPVVVPAPVVPVQMPVIVQPAPVKPKVIVTLDDQQKQATEIEALAKKSEELYHQIANIADDESTQQTKKKMAQVDTILNNLKISNDRLLEEMQVRQWREEQAALKLKLEQRRAEIERIYREALDYLANNNYAKAKLKFLVLDNIYPNYRATRQYISQIEEDQKRAGVQAVANHQNQAVNQLKELQDQESSVEVRKAREAEDAEFKHEQEQQVALHTLSQKASDINDQIIDLSRSQDYSAMKLKFVELENTVAALKTLKDEMATDRETQENLKKNVYAAIARRDEVVKVENEENRQIYAYDSEQQEREHRPNLADLPTDTEYYKHREVLQEQSALFHEAVDRYENKKYTQAKLLFGELANLHDRRAEYWLKKVDRAITKELLNSQESEEREQTAFIADQVNAQRELIIIQERERQRQKKLTEELENQKRLYEDDHLYQLRKEEILKAQEREREQQEEKRARLEKQNQKQDELLRFHKIETSSNQPAVSTQLPPIVVPPNQQYIKDQQDKELQLKAEKARIQAERELEDQKRREETLHQQDLQRQEKLEQEKIMREEAQHRQEIEREERQRQIQLDEQRELVRKQLEEGVESMYQEALSLYKEGQYASAADRFKDVQDIIPGYKNSDQYLNDAHQKSIVDNSQSNVPSVVSNDSNNPTPVPSSETAPVSRQDSVSKALDLFDPNAK